MKKVLALVAVVVVVGGVVWFNKGGSSKDAGGLESAKYAEPADAVDSFYKQWLDAAKDPSAQPTRAQLVKYPVLTGELSAKLEAALAANATPDPVLCQSTVPAGITIRNVYVNPDDAEILVTSKDKNVTNQAVVSLEKTSDSWVINKIECKSGEFAPEREFTFEHEGFLIKNSIPKPYNNKVWHIIFTQDGIPGNAAPLLFDAKSQCTNLEGVKSVCMPDQFKEAIKIKVYGQMTERGVSVVRLEFVK